MGGERGRNERLFDETEQEEAEAAGEVAPAGLAQLGQKVAGPLNGPGHELGEKGHEHGEGEQVALRGNAAAVDVEGVPKGLEGVEADAHREDQVEGPVAFEAEEGAGFGDEEIGVFEEGEDAEIGQNGGQQPNLPLTRILRAHERPSHEVIDRGREHDQPEK